MARKACGAQVTFGNKTFHIGETRVPRELGDITSLVWGAKREK